MTKLNDLKHFDRKMRADAHAIELAWLGSGAPAPSPTPPPLESEATLAFTLSESLYAAAVQDLLEESGISEAAGNVIENRATLAAYRDVGAEPWEVVKHILSR